MDADRFDGATVIKKANVYFEGRCISHTVLLADGSRKSVGVILPSALRFTTGAAETMEILSGRCRVRPDGAAAWQEHGPGTRFSVPAQSAFDIETLETVDYVCHFH